MSCFRFCFLVFLTAVSAGCRNFNRDGEPEGTNVGECADGAENDSDGDYDCDDEDCAGAPDCEAEVGDMGSADSGD